MNTLTTIIFILIAFILGIVITLAVELFFIWLLIFREDKRDDMKTDYDETGDY